MTLGTSLETLPEQKRSVQTLLNAETMIESIVLSLDGASGFKELEFEVASIMYEYLELWKKKQKSYGPGNIAKFGELGCLIRATDKLERLRNLVYLKKADPLDDENVQDTWLDLMGYALMGLMCKRSIWPGVESNAS